MDIRKGWRISSTNSLAKLLDFPERLAMADFDSIDILARLRADETEKYEEKEKEIPELIFEVIKKNSSPLTKFVKRSFIEEDAWLVSVECREGEHLLDHGQEVYSGSKSGQIVPALIEEGVSEHFVKIHVPRIFVRTVSLPMMIYNH
jgi:hypothetical protein